MPYLYYRKGNVMRGPAVRRFQEVGEAVLGEDIVENDGAFGTDTKDLALAVQKKLGLEVDGYVGPKTWEACFAALGREKSGAKVYERDGVTVKDCRNFGEPPKRGFFGKVREWGAIEGVMLHQTGCWMPEEETTWCRVNAHCGVTRNGTVILMHDFQWEIWHGNGLSKQTIGIETAGNFYGVPGVKGTWWSPGGGPHQLNEKQQHAFEVLFHILHEAFDEGGGNWKKVYAHRQSSSSREGDPGQEIWQKVGMVWQTALGADDGGPNYCVGSGNPIPKEWNPTYGRRYWE